MPRHTPTLRPPCGLVARQNLAQCERDDSRRSGKSHAAGAVLSQIPADHLRRIQIRPRPDTIRNAPPRHAIDATAPNILQHRSTSPNFTLSVTQSPCPSLSCTSRARGPGTPCARPSAAGTQPSPPAWPRRARTGRGSPCPRRRPARGPTCGCRPRPRRSARTGGAD